jgi:hypothetical protein
MVFGKTTALEKKHHEGTLATSAGQRNANGVSGSAPNIMPQ